MQVIVPPGRGRRPAPILYNVTRHLSETDIASLWEARKDGATPKLQTLRYNHHLLAKAVASGKSLIECSNLTGLSGPRISDLKNDPAFQELVSYYAEELNEVYIDVHQRMAALGTSVLEELAERFESDPEKFTKRELMDLFTTMADRSIATAKGGPTPQQAIQAAGPGGAGLALQINFVSPQGEAPQTIEATTVNVLPAEGVRGDDQKAHGAPPAQKAPYIEIPIQEEPLDGEPLVPIPAPYPTRPEILQAKRDLALKQIEEREAEVAERERIHEEYLRKKREQLNG
jgi:hypothetical protein